MVSLCASAAFVMVASLAGAQGPAPSYFHKFDNVVLGAVRAGESARVIVRFHDEAARSQGAATIAARGGHVRRAFGSVRALNATLDAATVALLAADAGVANISIDAEVRSTATVGWGSSVSSGVSAVHENSRYNGRGVTVGLIDSGVSPHADLPAERILKLVDFVHGRSAPYDDYGHGTHVAGILAGSGAASAESNKPYVGAAPRVDIVALKVLDARGAGRTSDVIAALEWVATNHQRYDIRVVNLSLGHPVFEPAATDPLVQAAEALVREGIVVVASAGNRGIDPRDGDVGYGGISSPANGPSIIAVGAVDTQGTYRRSDDQVTRYSSRGPTRFDLIVKPDLVAAGHDVVSLAAPGSTLFEKYPALHVEGDGSSASYMLLSGTSMAAPAVAGAAALMLDANPRLTAGAVHALLEFTSQRLTRTDVMTQGAGYLNTAGAVRLAGLVKPQASVGTVWLRRHNAIPRPFDVLLGERVAWAKLLLWGDRALLGDFAYLHVRAWDDNIVWGEDNVVWGEDNIVWGEDNIVWGEDNIVWGEDNVVWGEDNIVWGESETLLAYWAANTVSGFWSAALDWTAVKGEDNIVWGEAAAVGGR